MALENIRQRLDLAFPGRSAVEVEDAAETWRVRLRFPRVGDEAARGSGASFARHAGVPPS
jgi:hypothetical protein